MSIKPITDAYLTLTHKCCCECTYCFVKQNSEMMSLDIAKKSVDWLWNNYEGSNKNIRPSINFFGGEPLICYNNIIVPLTNYIRKKYGYTFCINITTNGILFTEEILDFLSKNKIGLLLSFDGIKEIQDKNRPLKSGESSFDNIFLKLPLIKKYYPKIQMRATLSPETAKYLYDIILFAEENNIGSLIIRPDEYVSWDGYLDILKNEIHKIGDYIINRCRNNILPLSISSFENTFKQIKQINTSIEINYDKRAIGGQCGNCGLGIGGSVGIAPDGTIYSCQSVSSMPDEIKKVFNIGNIFEGINEVKREKLRNKLDCSKVYGELCKECHSYRICRGQCVLENLIVNKDMNHAVFIGCFWEQTWLEEGIRVMQLLGEEKNEIFKNLWQNKRWINESVL